jgi:hypothetical protein
VFTKFLVHRFRISIVFHVLFSKGKQLENIPVLHGNRASHGDAPGDAPPYGRGSPGDAHAPQQGGARRCRDRRGGRSLGLEHGRLEIAEEHVRATPSEPRPRDRRLLVGATGGACHGAAS